MEVGIELLIRFWYLWVLVIAVGILELFMPRIKGFFGEKSVSFFLSRLDKTKYMVINDIIGDFPEVNYIPIVVFTTKADLRVKSKTDVIYTINLIKTIKKYNKQTLRDSIKKQIYSKLISLSIDGKENRKAHVAQIQNRLIDNNNKINNDICPRCGGKLVLRKSKYGQFKGCSNYPKCRFIFK